MSIVSIHPMIVHFPIALLLTSIFLDILSIIMKKERLGQAAADLLLLGLFTAGLAIVAGIAAEDKVSASIPDIAGSIDMHETMAIITTIIFILLCAFRWIMKSAYKRFRRQYIIASLVGAILIIITAFLGGRLVYDYGAAVKTVPSLKSMEAPR